MKYNMTANDVDMEHDKKNSVARMVKGNIIIDIVALYLSLFNSCIYGHEHKINLFNALITREMNESF